jgi:hypothetical protein
MKFVEYDDAENYLHLLENRFSKPWENDLMIGLVAQLCKDKTHFKTNAGLYAIEDENEIKLVSFLTQPWPMIIYADSIPNDQIISFFIDSLVKKEIILNGINAKKELSTLFMKKWTKKTNCSSKKKMEMNLFVLHELTKIPSCPGRFVLADGQYKDLIVEWATSFHREVPIGNNSKSYIQDHVDLIIRSKNAFIWIDDNPVCMVFRERPTKNSFSIGYVYTPKKYRNRGYASNLVYQMCSHSFAEGFSYCTLFADVNNPTSNSIYKKIGFREICLYAMYDFD